jgi:hypothetical protein
MGFQAVSCTDWTMALSHSHLVADFTGPCAVIYRYRLEAYATLLLQTLGRASFKTFGEQY